MTIEYSQLAVVLALLALDCAALKINRWRYTRKRQLERVNAALRCSRLYRDSEGM